MSNLIRATWAMEIEEEVLVQEMLATGEYGIGGHPISEESMVEFFRNWAFGLDPLTYEGEWDSNPHCYYHLDVADGATGRELWQATYLPREAN
jgi:hypothetical protein